MKHEAASGWLERIWESKQGAISVQVLNEFYNTVTRKLRHPMSVDDARADVRDLQNWTTVALTASVVEAAFEVETRFGFSWWDSLVVASAQFAHCDILLTEDLQDGQNLVGMRVVDPFSHPPDEVLGPVE